MALSLTDSQQAVGKLSFKDKKGFDTDVADGAVEVSSSDDSIAEVSYDDAKNEITVVAGQPGVAAITVKATASNGSDLPFEDTAVEVKSGDAVGGSIDFSSPVEQA